MSADGHAEAKEGHFDGEMDEDRVMAVELDGLALLKIVKRSADALPSLATGPLMGLYADGVLQVTHCFPLPPGEDDTAEFQVEMMKMLREVNVDNNCVGWFSAAYMGTFCSAALVQTQFNYQDSLGPNAVVLVYDPVLTTRGQITLKALRLTDEFFAAMKEGLVSADDLRAARLESGSIFEEVPVRIRSRLLASALVRQLSAAKGDASLVDTLNLATETFLEKNVELLTESIEDLSQEQVKVHGYERALARQRTEQQRFADKRKAENAALAAQGKPLLPDTDPTAACFQPIAAPR